MKLQLKDKYIYIIAAINSLLLITIFGVQTYPDSPTYAAAWDNHLSHGEIDMFRTPIYPFFLGLCKIFAGTYYQEFAICLQHAVLIVSVYYFKKIAALFISSEKVVWLVSLVYAIIYSLSTWANLILTESFAISGIVFLYYNIVSFFKKGLNVNAVWGTFWLAFLIMLRPAFVYLFPVCLIVWLFAMKRNVKTASWGVWGVLLCAGLYLGYSAEFKARYGLFATSSVNTINQLCLAFEYDLMQPELTDDKEYKEYITGRLTGDTCLQKTSIFDEYGLVTVQKSIENSYKTYPSQWVKKLAGRFYRASQAQLAPSYLRTNDNSLFLFIKDLINIVELRLNSLYLFLLAYFVVLLKWMLKSHTAQSLSLFFWLSVVANVLTAIIGAQAEWGRLIIPSTPLLLIMLGQATNYIGFKSASEHKDILL